MGLWAINQLPSAVSECVPLFPFEEDADRLRRAEQQGGAAELELTDASQELGQGQVLARLGTEHPAVRGTRSGSGTRSTRHRTPCGQGNSVRVRYSLDSAPNTLRSGDGR